MSVGGALNLTTAANHIQCNGADRISFIQDITPLACAGSLTVSNVLTASRLEATGTLPNSYPTAGVYCGKFETVGFAYVVLNSQRPSANRQIDFQYVGAIQDHATLVSLPNQDEFMISMNRTPRLTIDATQATVHSDLVCSGLAAFNTTIVGNATVDSLTVN